MQAIENLFSLGDTSSEIILPEIQQISEHFQASPQSWGTVQTQLRTHTDWERVLSKIPSTDAEAGYVRELIFTLLYLPGTTQETQNILTLSKDPILQAFIDSDKYYVDYLRPCVGGARENKESLDFPTICSRLNEIYVGEREPQTDLTHHERSLYTPGQIHRVLDIVRRLGKNAESLVDDRRKNLISDEIIPLLEEGLPHFFSYSLLFNAVRESPRGPPYARNIARNNCWGVALSLQNLILDELTRRDPRFILLKQKFGSLGKGYAVLPETVLTLRDTFYAYCLEIERILDDPNYTSPSLRPSLKRILPY